ERIWRTESAIMVLLPTLQTAIAGFGLAALAAVGLSIIAPVSPPPARTFGSLPEAVLALAPGYRAQGPEAAMAIDVGHSSFASFLVPVPSESDLGVTRDGYRVFADRPHGALVAVKAGAQIALCAPLDDAVGVPSLAAVHAGASLILGPPDAGAPVAASLGQVA